MALVKHVLCEAELRSINLAAVALSRVARRANAFECIMTVDPTGQVEIAINAPGDGNRVVFADVDHTSSAPTPGEALADVELP